MEGFDEKFDVVVVGGGNAGFTAATTAAQAGARVCLVEKAPSEHAGGNTYFTEGRYRYCFGGLQDLLPFLYHSDGTKGLPQDLVEKIEIAPYTEAEFYDDIHNVERETQTKADPALTKVLVENSRDAIRWLAENGAKLTLSFDQEPPLVDGIYKFSGGWVTHMLGRGKQLFEWHVALAKKHGIAIYFNCPAVELILDPLRGDVAGVKVNRDGQSINIAANGGVILASGGYPSSLALRSEFLGPGWDTTQVRGSKYSTGEGHDMAQAIGGKLVDKISNYYAITRNGGLSTLSATADQQKKKSKSGYPLGVAVNVDGKRFVDEGQDARSFTYPIIGREIADQPYSISFLVWDAVGSEILEKGNYDDTMGSKFQAYTLEDLAKILERKGLRNKEQFLATISEFNEACKAQRLENPELAFDPSVPDGLSTQSNSLSLSTPKSNWAIPLEKGPFRAIGIACGITFGHGGVTVSPGAEVLREESNDPIPGLWCSGEVIGGLFWHGSPRGSGLTMGTVLGRIAGEAAARRARDGGKRTN